MKKNIFGVIGILFLLTSCSSEKQKVTTDTLSSMSESSEISAPAESEDLATDIITDLWEQTDSKEDGRIVEFATGLQIIFPKEWENKIIIETDAAVQTYGGGLIVCEKQNDEMNSGGGMLFALEYYKYDEKSIAPNEIFGTDRVLGVYQKGGEIYALIFTRPRDMQYVEGNAELQQIYEEVDSFTDKVQVITSNMEGFTECGLDDLDWIILSGTDQPEVVKTVNYQSKSIELEYPAAWKIKKKVGEDGNVVRFYDEGGENIFWLEQGEAWRADLNTSEEEYKKQLSESYQEVEIIELSEMKVDGHDAQKLIFSCTINGEKRTISRYIVIAGYAFFEFSYMDTLDMKAENNVGETVMSSVIFIDTD